jgi:N-acetylglucosaminyldiphosphoundecaprenol N-acetyl-beta-D-mannosaminyltransferase
VVPAAGRGPEPGYPWLPMDQRAGGTIFGVRLDDLPSREALRAGLAELLDGPGGARVFTPNPEILLLAHRDPSYAAVLRSASLSPPDGAGVALVQTLRRRRRLRRWPGVDIGAVILGLAAERGERGVLVGGSQGVAALAAARWRAAFPHLTVAVAGDGVAVADDGRAADPALDATLTEAVRAASPAIVLVGLGAPKQERWIDAHAADLPDVKVFVGVGGAFDMWSGRLRRAPAALRRAGLEWAWRVVLEPSRLPRIVRATVVFPFRALTDRDA